MRFTRFGILTTNFSYGLPSDRLFQRVVEIAEAVEATAFDSLWLPDHLVQGPVGDVEANEGRLERTVRGPNGPHAPIFDAPTMLSALAVVTTRVRIGPLVSPVTFRHPAVLAKSITTVDVVSSGRAVLGLGAAWDADEHRRYGFPFPPPGERVGRLEEAVQICRAMFDDTAASVGGTYHAIDEAYNVPRPVSNRIPILVGGSGPRTLRVAARYADACNPFGDAEHIRQVYALVEQHCHEVGRDPAEVARIAGVMFHRVGDLYRLVEEAFEAGSEGIILVPWQLALSPDEIVTIGDRLAAEFGGS